jgi:hypothetical protein
MTVHWIFAIELNSLDSLMEDKHKKNIYITITSSNGKQCSVKIKTVTLVREKVTVNSLK